MKILVVLLTLSVVLAQGFYGSRFGGPSGFGGRPFAGGPGFGMQRPFPQSGFSMGQQPVMAPQQNMAVQRQQPVGGQRPMGAPTAQPQQKWIDRPQEPLNADSWALHEGRQGEVVEPVVEEIQGHARPGQNIQ